MYDAKVEIAAGSSGELTVASTSEGNALKRARSHTVDVQGSVAIYATIGRSAQERSVGTVTDDVVVVDLPGVYRLRFAATVASVVNVHGAD